MNKPKGPLADQHNAAFDRRPEFQVKRARLLAKLNALCRFHPVIAKWRTTTRQRDQQSAREQVRLQRPEIHEKRPRARRTQFRGPGDLSEGGDEPGSDPVSGAMLPNLGQTM